jgi:hypothetical protein
MRHHAWHITLDGGGYTWKVVVLGMRRREAAEGTGLCGPARAPAHAGAIVPMVRGVP